jgi:hypothetical protein
MARVKSGKLLLLVFTLFVLTSVELRASTDTPLPAATSFAYPISHPFAPLPEAVIETITEQDGETLTSDEPDEFDLPLDRPVILANNPPRVMTHNGLCSAVAAVARAHDLPIPFFANLIWQESKFDTRTISRAGAQGIAQFMPQTAVEYGLINPFEPIHALNVAGKFLSELHGQFGNLGLAAAAYNAGPRRVIAWLAKRGPLPRETRNYVVKVTGRPAEDWASAAAKTDPEVSLMPAKAPCVEVAEAVAEQERVVRIAKLMNELALATAAPETGDGAGDAAATETKGTKAKPHRKSATTRLASAEPGKPADSKARSSAKSSTKTAAKSSTKTAAQSSTKTAAKSSTKTAAKSSTKTAAKSPAKSPDKSLTKPSTKIAVKASTKPANKGEGESKVAGKTENKIAHKPGGKPSGKPDGMAGETKVAVREDSKETSKSATPRRPSGHRRTRIALFDRHALR